MTNIDRLLQCQSMIPISYFGIIMINFFCKEIINSLKGKIMLITINKSIAETDITVKQTYITAAISISATQYGKQGPGI